MTIRSHIDVRSLVSQLELFERCAEESPAGTYEPAKNLAGLIASTANGLLAGVRALGMHADNCDGIREVEAIMYGWVKDSNPDSTVFPVSEGFGSAIDGVARDRVLSQAAEHRDLFSRFGQNVK